jgi:predicted DNA-binding transcriptional regulator AlpA
MSEPNYRSRPKRRAKREAWPRGLRRSDASDYVGVSPSTFDSWIDLHILPRGKRIGGVVLWDRFALDEAVDALFYSDAEPDLTVWDDDHAES